MLPQHPVYATKLISDIILIVTLARKV